MPPGSAVRTGKLVVNLDDHVVLVDGRQVHLTGREYAILELLSVRKGTALTKEMILDHLYGGADEPEAKIIDNLRLQAAPKLVLATGGKHYIETVWGRGYVLRDPTSPEMTDHFGADHDEGGDFLHQLDSLSAASAVSKDAIA